MTLQVTNGSTPCCKISNLIRTPTLLSPRCKGHDSELMDHMRVFRVNYSVIDNQLLLFGTIFFTRELALIFNLLLLILEELCLWVLEVKTFVKYKSLMNSRILLLSLTHWSLGQLSSTLIARQSSRSSWTSNFWFFVMVIYRGIK